MSSSQLGQPFFLKSVECWMMEQRRHARRCLDRACWGMAAMMVAKEAPNLIWLHKRQSLLL
jgi:hypothetical protein